VITCVNCESEAKFQDVISASKRVPFCPKHVPAFLKSGKYRYRLQRIVPAPVVEAEPVVEKPKRKRATKADEPVVTEPVVEEPVIEPEEVSEPVVEDAVDADDEVVEGE
jgi:hypothetical protein